MSAEKRRNKKGFLYTKEIIVWVLLFVFLTGLLVYHKDRILGKEKESTGEETQAESEDSMFDDTGEDAEADHSQDSEPALTEPEAETPGQTEALTVPEGSGPLSVYFLDVAEGDAAVLTLNGEVMVIDGGDEAHAGVLTSWLQKLGIGRVDYMISSHPHKDHAGGLPAVYQTAAVGKMYTPVTEYAENASFTELMRLAGEQGTEVIVPTAGSTFGFGGAEVTFLGPTRYNEEEMNNNSLVVRVRFGSRTFLFTGDAEAVEEADILSSGADVKADILKVSHHGSPYASSEAFVQAVQPEACVISVGQNEYGHPSGDVLQRFSAVGAIVYETWISGTITVVTDGTSLQWNFER